MMSYYKTKFTIWWTLMAIGWGLCDA